jgi:adenosylcobinamide-phosphate synthase
MTTALSACIGVALDAALGEPRRWHPLVGFGTLATRLERRMLAKPGLAERPVAARVAGAGAVAVLVAPPVAAVAAASTLVDAGLIVDGVALYFALGARSLAEHAAAVAEPLAAGDLAAARARVALIVSRDTDDMDAADVSRAAVESVLENGSDAVFATLFWFAVAGGTGAVAHRLVNTLDAMWGYRTERFRFFGWAAARLDDALNWLPARLTALTYAALGRTRDALACWRDQSSAWYSPNAGPAMAAGAGALGVALGGAARYHGAVKARPALGLGRAPGAPDIGRAVRLVRLGTVAWLAVMAAIDVARWWLD